MKHLTPITAFVFLAATAAVAENELTPLDAPAERPYPYEILGLQPGNGFDDVLGVYAERTDAAPTSESEVLRVQSPEGNVFECLTSALMGPTSVI